MRGAGRVKFIIKIWKEVYVAFHGLTVRALSTKLTLEVSAHDLFLFTYYFVNAIEITVLVRDVTANFPQIRL